MIIKNKRQVSPPWNTTIWRYLSFEKFLDIIINEHLFFTNSTRFTDKNEGTLSELTQKRLRNKFLSEGENQNEASLKVINHQIDIELQKRFAYLNCWTIDHDESYALWKIYLGGSRSGIAIKTNVKRLIDSIESNKKPNDIMIYLEKVLYEDFIIEPIDLLGALTTKRKYYKYETELRLIQIDELPIDRIIDNKMTRLGKTIHINPKTLIDQIFLSPFASKSFHKIVKQTLDLINPIYVPRIRNSEIDDS